VTSARDATRHARDDVAEVLIRYGTGIDRRDWTLFRSCFAEDCDADYGDIGVWCSADEITEFMRQVHDPLGYTLHRITNPAVDVLSETEASARSYVDALVMGPDGTAYRVAGYYDDHLVRGAEGWKIVRRHFTMVHQTTEAGG
jgi:3-phenylpropionate/cinnamic acid dioxygenase small subunit